MRFQQNRGASAKLQLVVWVADATWASPFYCRGQLLGVSTVNPWGPVPWFDGARFRNKHRSNRCYQAYLRPFQLAAFSSTTILSYDIATEWQISQEESLDTSVRLHQPADVTSHLTMVSMMA